MQFDDFFLDTGIFSQITIIMQFDRFLGGQLDRLFFGMPRLYLY